MKHGALTRDGGKILIQWDTKANGGREELLLSWRETGVDLQGKDPSRDGFGMELLLRSLPYDLQCETTVEFLPAGLLFELRMPLTAAE